MTKNEDILRSPTSHSGTSLVFEICFSMITSFFFIEIPTRTTSPANVLSRGGTSIKDKSIEQWKIADEFRYCATCGRGVGVRLTACNRCQKVYFCSKTCKVDGWNQFHRFQCRLLANTGKTKIIEFTSNNSSFSSSSTRQNCHTSQGNSLENSLLFFLSFFVFIR